MGPPFSVSEPTNAQIAVEKRHSGVRLRDGEITRRVLQARRVLSWAGRWRISRASPDSEAEARPAARSKRGGVRRPCRAFRVRLEQSQAQLPRLRQLRWH